MVATIDVTSGRFQREAKALILHCSPLQIKSQGFAWLGTIAYQSENLCTQILLMLNIVSSDPLLGLWSTSSVLVVDCVAYYMPLARSECPPEFLVVYLKFLAVWLKQWRTRYRVPSRVHGIIYPTIPTRQNSLLLRNMVELKERFALRVYRSIIYG